MTSGRSNEEPLPTRASVSFATTHHQEVCLILSPDQRQGLIHPSGLERLPRRATPRNSAIAPTLSVI